MLTNQVFQCFSQKCLTENPCSVLQSQKVFQSYYSRGLLWKNVLNLSHVDQPSFSMFQLEVFNRKNSCPVLLTCAMVANSEYDYFAMFSLPLWATMISRVIYFIKISTISFSFRLARHRLQSKRRSVHSSPASPLHFSRVQFIVHLVQNSASSSMQSSTA